MTNCFTNHTLKGVAFSLMMLFFSFTVMAQNQVSGTITDAGDGSGIPGASVIIKGTTSGTITDINGNFSISANSTDVLVVSYVGYASQEITVGNQASITVAMDVDTQQLAEVVVTGYTSQSRRTISGAVGSVDVDQAFSVPLSNAAEGLQGRVSGVNVLANGQPGSDPIVRIRGFGTPNNNNPLYVIDGFQTNDGSVLSQISPDDIESINVLKDASSASIYGARAANGVIVITTKSGSYTGSKPTITINSFIGAESVGSTPSVLNTQQHGEMIFESIRNDGGTPDHPIYGNGANPVVPDFIRGNSNAPYDPAAGGAGNRITRSGDTDWYDEIFQTGLFQNYNLSVEGGSQKAKYFTSLGYQNREGILKNGGFERFTTRLNTDFRINDNIRVGEHVSIGYTDRQRLQEVEALQMAGRMSPVIPALDEGGNFAGTGPSTSSGLSNTRSPLAVIERTAGDFDRTLTIFADAFLEVTLPADIIAKTTIGVTYDDLFGNDFTFLDPEHSEPISTNQLTEDNFLSTSWVWTNTLTWERDFGDHNLNALLGVEAIKNTDRENRIDVTDFIVEDGAFRILRAGTGTPNINRGTFDKSTLSSIFGRIGYNYQGKYLATASVRGDKTSRFTDNSDTFLSGSLGWIISEEAFMQSQGFIDNLKLRVSYGELGNQELPRSNPDQDIFILDQQFGFYPFNGANPTTGATLDAVGNVDLKWETSRQFNLGLDVGLLDNDLSFSFDYFDITTDNLIVANPIVATGIDAQAPFVNVGEVSNSGVDISVTYGNYSKGSDLKYNFTFVLSAVDNEVEELFADRPDAFITGQGNFRGGPITRTQAGSPISVFYGRVVDGIFQNEAEVTAAADQGFATPADGVGRFRYRDLDNDGDIDDDDRTTIGSPHADFTYGLNANISYKNFDLTAYFQGSQGNDIYNYNKIFTDFPTFFNGNRSTRVLDSWSETNPGGSLPALSENITNNETAPNSFFVEDGSYLRLKNLQLGYNIPSSVLSNIGVLNARVYVQGTNLFTIAGYDGLDPEFQSTADPNNPAEGGTNLTLGVDEGRFYPVSRIFTVGVKATF